jgi:hypothetical protein
VDAIHTCGGLYGYTKPLGHVDFYPNGGMFFQPGCANVVSFGMHDLFFFNFCSPPFTIQAPAATGALGAFLKSL